MIKSVTLPAACPITTITTYVLPIDRYTDLDNNNTYIDNVQTSMNIVICEAGF